MGFRIASLQLILIYSINIREVIDIYNDDQFKMKRTLDEGDLCSVDEYGDRVWQVVGWTREQPYMAGEYSEEIVYNLMCVVTSDWAIGIQSDTTLLCKSEYAYEYIKNISKNSYNVEEFPWFETYISDNSIQNIIQDLELLGVDIMNQDKIEDINKLHEYPDTINGMLDKIVDIKLVEDCVGELTIEQQDELHIAKERLEVLRKEL